MSGPKVEMYVPGMWNCDGELVPSVPNRMTFLCACWASRPNCWALAAACHGSTATCSFDVSCEVTSDDSALDNVAPVSVPLIVWWLTLIPAFSRIGIITFVIPCE